MSPKTVIPLLLGALALAGNPARAGMVEELAKEARRRPRDPAAAHDLARRLRRAGMYEDAIRVARTALASARGKGPVGDLFLEVARARIAERDQKAAMRECARLEKIDDIKWQICIAEAELLRRRGSLALPAAEAVLRRDPKSYDGLVAKGRALAQLGKPAQAEAMLRDAAARVRERPEAPEALAHLLIDGGRVPAALKILRAARELAPTEPDLLLLLGEHLTDGTEAIVALRQAIAARPSAANAHALLGRRLRLAGDLPGAEQALARALSLDATRAEWHVELGNVHLAQHHADKALADARAALGIVSNHAGAKLVEANALAQKGDIDLAIAAYEAASGLASRDPAPLVDAVAACVEHGRPTTARAFADRVTSEFPTWGPGWVALGDAAVAGGDEDDARVAYRKALTARGPVDRAAVQKKLSAIR